jgi:hypothetical protein
MNTNTPSGEEKTELLYGVEAALGKGVWFMKNVKIGMDLFGEKNGMERELLLVLFCQSSIPDQSDTYKQ